MITKGKQTRAPLIVIGGEPKTGKTFLIGQCPWKPLILDCGASAGIYGFDRIECGSVEALAKGLAYALQNLPSEYQSVWIDDIGVFVDWKVSSARADGKDTYGAEYAVAKASMHTVVELLLSLRAKGLIVGLTCHTKVRTLDVPDCKAYDRVSVSLPDATAEVVRRSADVISILRSHPVSEGNVVIAEKRVIYSTPTYGHDAGNRIGMPAMVAASSPEYPAAEYWRHVKRCLESTKDNTNAR